VTTSNVRAPARWLAALAAGALLYGAAGALLGQDDRATQEIQKYRQMLEEGNPADLIEARGEELWRTPRGPKHATLERCDLGLGPGKLEGAYAKLPRYFADSDKVEDAESRLVTCMMALQGYTYADAIKNWYSTESDIQLLVTYIAAQSKGAKIDVPATQPREAELAAAGEALFFRRSGPLDFSCATCHSRAGRRVRLQEVADFLVPEDARAAMIKWPAYRVSQGEVWTMERRLIDCIRQMRWPEPQYQSEALIALQVFLQKQASGGVMDAPGMKR
jgi:sulfur-oxidizing protein SoxA